MSRSLYARLARRYRPKPVGWNRREFLQATLAASAGQVLPVRVTGHGGYTPGDIDSVKFAFSYDGGTTWTDAVVSNNAGAWTATVDHTGASGKTVATRVEVADSKGATVTQVVKAAYAVR